MASAVRFAVVSTTDTITDHLGPFCEQLEVTSGVSVLPRVVATFGDLTAAFGRAECEIAWVPPLIAVELEDAQLGAPLVGIERRSGGYHAALFTHSRGRFRSLDDVHDASVAWVTKDSASGYLAPRWHLRSQGYDLARLLTRETFAGTHEAVARAVLGQEVDLGASYVGLDPATRKLASAPWLDVGGEDARAAVRVLLLLGPIPSDVLVLRRGVDDETRERLSRALLAMRPDPEGPSERLFRAARFEPVRAGHLALLRDLARFER